MPAWPWRSAPASAPAPAHGGELSEARRFEALDSLRGVCALTVALFHFHTRGTISNFLPVQKGWLFVDFFFVLSGFVIAHAYFGRIAGGFSPWRFLGLRLGRIYPLHLAILLAMLAVELLLAWHGALAGRPAFDAEHNVRGFMASLLLLNSSGATDLLVWNQPSWSIAAEFWTYALFALLALGGRVWPFAVTAVGAAALLLAFDPNLWDAPQTFGTIRCIYGFSLGVLLWAWAKGEAWRPGPAFGTLAELVVIAAILVLTAGVWTGPGSMLAAPLFACAVMIFAAEAGWVSRLLRTAPFVLVGTLSYSIYMVHQLVDGRIMAVLARMGLAVRRGPELGDLVTAAPFVSDLITLAMLLLVIAAAGLSYVLIERPGRLWSRHRLATPAARKAETVAPTF